VGVRASVGQREQRVGRGPGEEATQRKENGKKKKKREGGGGEVDDERAMGEGVREKRNG